MIVPNDMTIGHIAELKSLLIEEARSSTRPELDLCAVREIDSAGVQLLYVARSEAAAAGRQLRIVGCSAVVREILELVGFGLE